MPARSLEIAPRNWQSGSLMMAEFVHHALFGVYPYIALSVFLIGSLIRFDTDQYGWRSKSSQLLRRRQLIVGSVLFHVGILGILMGHGSAC